MATEPHKVTLVLDRESVAVRLVCPEGGCGPPQQCAECGRPIDGREAEANGHSERCVDCPTPPDECWIKTWFDNLRGEEMLEGPECDLTGRTLPVPIKCWWDGDSLCWCVAEEAPDAPW
jgi:hypothetical protein